METVESVQQEGNYRGSITSLGLQEGKPDPANPGATRSLMLYVACNFTSFLPKGGQWQELRPEKFGDGYICLQKNNGDYMTDNILNLSEALGWDSTSVDENGESNALEVLTSADYSNVLVECTIKYEEYKGKSKFKISWLRAPREKPDVDVKTLGKQWGAGAVPVLQQMARDNAIRAGKPVPVAPKPAPVQQVPAPNLKVVEGAVVDFDSGEITEESVPF